MILPLVLLGAIGIYIILFLRLPSVAGMADQEGHPIGRWFDLLQVLFIEQYVEATFGYGIYPVGVFDRIPIVAFALSWLGLAYAIGRPAYQWISRHTPLSREEVIAGATLIGLSALSTLVFSISYFTAYSNRWTLFIGVAGLLIASQYLTNRVKLTPTVPDRSDQPLARTPRPAGLVGRAHRLVAVFSVFLATLYILGGCVTPWEFDVCEYHLQAPKEFFQLGRLEPLPHNVYANMPLAVEMHSLAAMTIFGGDDGWWVGGLAGKLITNCYALLTAIMLLGFLSRIASRPIGWIAFALYLSVPGIMHVSMAGLIDAVLGAYLLAAVALMLTFADRSTVTMPEVTVVSILACSAAASKYTGLIVVTVPVCVLMLRVVLKSKQITAPKFIVALAAGFVMTVGPWYLKNTIEFSNPVYPLASSIFGESSAAELDVDRWNEAHDPDAPVSGRSPYSPLALLGNIKQIFLESIFLGPFTIPLFFVGLILAWQSRGSEQARPEYMKLIGMLIPVACWILLVWWVWTHRIDRFWLALVPIYSISGAIGLDIMSKRLNSYIPPTIAILSLMYAILVGLAGTLSDNRFFVALEALRADAATDERPGRLDYATWWINENLPRQQTKLLLIGEAKVFDFLPKIAYATCFNRNPAELILRDQPPSVQIKRLTEQGWTHIMIDWDEIRRYRSPGNYGFSDWPTREDIQRLVDDRVVERVEWPISNSSVELFRVNQESASESNPK